MARLVMKGFLIHTRKDGFMDATQICEYGRREPHNWYSQKRNIALMDLLKHDLASNHKPAEVIDIDQTNGRVWIHPLLVVPLASWVSLRFTISASLFIEDWKHQHDAHVVGFESALTHTRSPNNVAHDDPDAETEYHVMHENELRDKYKALLGGDAEVKTPSGNIDLLTPTMLIELKVARNWKHGVGQLICYGAYYEDHSLHLYLFNHSVLNATKKDEIKRVCARSSITVKYIDDDVAQDEPDASSI